MSYETELMCFSYACWASDVDKVKHLIHSNKILLPESILYSLKSSEDLNFPLFFKIINKNTEFGCICGLEEFSSPPGVCHIPYHVMNNISVNEGENVQVVLMNIPEGTYAKFRFHESEFPNFEDSKKKFESIISKDYPVINQGQTLQIFYNNKVHLVDVLETKPNEFINIINVNLNVDFDTPLDDDSCEDCGGETKVPECPSTNVIYTPPEVSRVENYKIYKPWSNGFVPFSGKGYRLGS